MVAPGTPAGWWAAARHTTLSRRQAHAIKQEYTDKLVQAVGRMFADPQQNPQPLRDLALEMDERLATVLGSEVVKGLDRAG